jgi:hypothetical protein
VASTEARAVVIGTAAIRPMVPTALRTSSWAISWLVSSSRSGVVPAAKSSISGSDAPA